MADLLDFFSLRDSILEDTSNGEEVAPGAVMLGVWARWRETVEVVLSPQNDLWLMLVEMDEFGVVAAVHDLEVWSDNPAAASLLPGQSITVKDSIADIRVLPDDSVRIVLDARG